MIKVIGRFVKCPCCNSVLKYEDEDIEETEEYDYEGCPINIGYIKCPTCGKLVELYNE